jgi:hypothetical protein
MSTKPSAVPVVRRQTTSRSETGSERPHLARNEIDPGSANHTCLSFLGLSQSRVELGVYKLDDTFEPSSATSMETLTVHLRLDELVDH